jgi:hypothetical protein
MSFSKFIEDLEKLEKISYENMAIVNITKFIIPEKEILKKILAERSPDLSDEDIELMAEAASAEEDPEAEDQEAEDQEAEDAVDPEEPIDPIERAKERRKREIRETAKQRKKELKEIYKKMLESLKEEVKKVKNDIKVAVFNFLNKFKEVATSFILAIIKSITSIPGAIVMAVLPPWNIPGAVTSLLVVLSNYLEVLSKVQQIIPFLRPLTKIPNIVGENRVNFLGKIFDVITLALIALYGPIIAFNKFIKKIIEIIKSLFSQKRNKKVFKQATKKLVKLGHIESTKTKFTVVIEDNEPKLKRTTRGIKRENDDNLPTTEKDKFELDTKDENQQPVTVEIFSYDEDDVEEILSLLNQFKIRKNSDTNNPPRWGGREHVYKYRNQKELDELQAQIEDIDKTINDEQSGMNILSGILLNEVGEDLLILADIDSAAEEFEQFVYDIVLPDGTVIPSISQEGLDYYRQKFDLIFKQI